MTEKAIKAVFFDFDGVLTPDTNDCFSTCVHLSRTAKIEFKQLYSCYCPFSQKLYAGRTTHETMWPEFAMCVGENVDIKLLDEAFRKTPVNEEVFALARELKAAGYKIGIITNNTIARMNAIRDELKLDELFDPIVVSAEIGVAKGGIYGGAGIFKKALEGLSPGEAVIIDNAKANLDIPYHLGFNTVCFDDAARDFQKLRGDLAALGVNC